MNRKLLTALLFVMVMSSLSLVSAESYFEAQSDNGSVSNYGMTDFDQKFQINMPSNAVFTKAEANTALGSSVEYDSDNVSVYYYEPLTGAGGEIGMKEIVKTLSIYQYGNETVDGNITILKDMSSNVENPYGYLVGAESKSGDVVFIGGDDLNTIKEYADSIEFSQG